MRSTCLSGLKDATVVVVSAALDRRGHLQAHWSAQSVCHCKTLRGAGGGGGAQLHFKVQRQGVGL